MPFTWTPTSQTASEFSGAVSPLPPLSEVGGYELRAWPHRSLPKQGFVMFIGLTAALMLVPLLAVVGSVVLWGLLPFAGGILIAIWVALQHSYRTGDVLEVLTLSADHITLTHRPYKGAEARWEANPFWVTAHLHDDQGPVEKYLTLKGGGREVELGAFLTVEEREQLYDDLTRHLNDARAQVR